jgi:hypothetical protein
MILDRPSPKSQFQEVGDSVEVSVNCTVSGAMPDATSLVKLATGTVSAEVTVMRLVWMQVLLPAAFVAVRVTV